MSEHATFSPSAAHRNIPCPGNMAFPENQQGGSSHSADEGTAAHTLAQFALDSGKPCTAWLGEVFNVNGTLFTASEGMCEYAQVYVDDVLNRVGGGMLMVEQRVDLSEYFGPNQFGTSDAIIFHEGEYEYFYPDMTSEACRDLLVVEDLKYGSNPANRVYARDNEQGMSYALGALEDAYMLGYSPSHVLIVICQPRLDHIDEWLCSVEELLAFGQEGGKAVKRAEEAIGVYETLGEHSPQFLKFLNPSEKACKWCRAAARCPARAKFAQDAMRSDFDTILIQPPPAPRTNDELSKAYFALPLIRSWAKSVEAEVHRLVFAGEEVKGTDGLPMKFVDGEDGNRVWNDEAAAEAALLGQLSEDKVYAPRKVITAPQAGKLLDKKKTAALWEDIFKPLITRKKGMPKLVLGSDSREKFTGAAASDEFEAIED